MGAYIVAIIFLVYFNVVMLAYEDNCPNGSYIFRRGLTQQEKQQVVDIHNKYRLLVQKGEIPKQPRAADLKKLVWDNIFAHASEAVTESCADDHIIERNSRWRNVGQNIYIAMKSYWEKPEPNWDIPCRHWFEEHKNYTFGQPIKPHIGHYTQMVWANTTHIGCSYIYFYNVEDYRTPYSKLFVCNYGPGGNIRDVKPYKVGVSKCKDLCEH